MSSSGFPFFSRPWPVDYEGRQPEYVGILKVPPAGSIPARQVQVPGKVLSILVTLRPSAQGGGPSQRLVGSQVQLVLGKNSGRLVLWWAVFCGAVDARMVIVLTRISTSLFAISPESGAMRRRSVSTNFTESIRFNAPCEALKGVAPNDGEVEADR